LRTGARGDGASALIRTACHVAHRRRRHRDDRLGRIKTPAAFAWRAVSPSATGRAEERHHTSAGGGDEQHDDDSHQSQRRRVARFDQIGLAGMVGTRRISQFFCVPSRDSSGEAFDLSAPARDPGKAWGRDCVPER